MGTSRRPVSRRSDSTDWVRATPSTCVERLQRGGGIRSIHEQLHLRGASGAHIAREGGRDLNPDVGAALAHFAFHFFQALHLSHHAKRLRVHETIDQLTALDSAIFVQDDRRHVFHVVVESVAERDHLDQRRKKHEEKRHRIAPDHDEFLEENCAESAKRFALHFFVAAKNGHR